MSYKIFIYTALPCEAKPLVEYFKLKKRVDIQPFAVYVQGEICLTVTGLGKSAMAAGVGYTQALFAAGEQAVLMNIGIAGHRDYAIGGLYMVDKIIDADSQRNYYPPLIGKALCPSCAIRTSSSPQLNYDHAELCDMEASAFYETATRFTTGELIHCLKVISDNQASPAHMIQAKQVSLLIADHVATIDALIVQSLALAALIIPPKTPLFEQLIQRYHFTASAQAQLKAQLARWAVLTDNQPLALDEAELRNSKDVLRWLEQHISTVAVFL
jgi:adenosylhomocysteine nucleosidase